MILQKKFSACAKVIVVIATWTCWAFKFNEIIQLLHWCFIAGIWKKNCTKFDFCSGNFFRSYTYDFCVDWMVMLQSSNKLVGWTQKDHSDFWWPDYTCSYRCSTICAITGLVVRIIVQIILVSANLISIIVQCRIFRVVTEKIWSSLGPFVWLGC